MFREAGFHLRDWSFNSKKLNNIIDPQLVVNSEVLPVADNDVNVLGMVCNTISDEMSFNNRNRAVVNKFITKRYVLSEAANIYDPLGILIPVTIRARILMQNV